MRNRFDTFKTAGWLLDESYDPMNYMTEAEEDENQELEDETSEEGDSDEDSDEENLDLDDDSDETDDLVDADDLDVDDNEDVENDTELDPTDIAGRLDAIEDKLDDIADNKQEPDEDETFDLDLSNPVCPCCGARLNILNSIDDTEDIANDEEGDEEATEDDDISALLAGETPEEGETEGEEISTMDDSLDDVDGLGYDDSEYVSLDDEAEEDDDEE